MPNSELPLSSGVSSSLPNSIPNIDGTGMPARPTWMYGALYSTFCDVFPDYRTKRGFFDVKRFMDEPEIRKSHEAVYKWFRSAKLTPANANAVINLANTAPNVAALALVGRVPPTIDDFKQFVF